MTSKRPTSQSIRIRVCGILEEEGAILLIKHRGIGPAGFLWSPPGGGLEFGEPVTERLKKEFIEETGLEIRVEHFLFTNEVIYDSIHTIELFFKVSKIKGKLILGTDPELEADEQILEEIRFIPYGEIASLRPETLHNAFDHLGNKKRLTELTGFVKFEDI